MLGSALTKSGRKISKSRSRLLTQTSRQASKNNLSLQGREITNQKNTWMYKCASRLTLNHVGTPWVKGTPICQEKKVPPTQILGLGTPIFQEWGCESCRSIFENIAIWDLFYARDKTKLLLIWTKIQKKWLICIIANDQHKIIKFDLIKVLRIM